VILFCFLEFTTGTGINKLLLHHRCLHGCLDKYWQALFNTDVFLLQPVTTGLTDYTLLNWKCHRSSIKTRSL